MFGWDEPEEKGFDELHDEVKAFVDKIGTAIEKGATEYDQLESDIAQKRARQGRYLE